MSFQAASPIPLRLLISLALDGSIFLLSIYLAMQTKYSLILLKLNGRCSNEPWREIDWKLLFYRSGSVGQSESYNSWMLMLSSSLMCSGLLMLRASVLFGTHWGPWESTGSITLLTWLFAWLLSLYDSWELSIGFLDSSSEVSLLMTILSWYRMMEVFKTTEELQEETVLGKDFSS